MCRSVIFSVCWYERTRACYNTLLVLCERARGAWLCSCHTVAQSTCPLIGVDLLDLLPLRLCYHLYALWKFFSKASSTKINQRQSSVFCLIQKVLCLHSGYVTWSLFALQLRSCYSVRDILIFNPTQSDFILWLWCRDVRFCAHLKLHREGSREMHSFASLATDVGKSIFSPFELNLAECLKTVRCGL